MNKYYIYHLKQDGKVSGKVFVEHLEVFAKDQFDPVNIDFSGVCIEADNLSDAYRAYRHPAQYEGVMSCDEPVCTAMQREDWEARRKLLLNTVGLMRARLLNVRRDLIIKSIAMGFAELSKNISLLAQEICGTDNQVVPPEDVFDMLIERHAEHLKLLKFHPYKG